jgi:hypothetical protein
VDQVHVQNPDSQNASGLDADLGLLGLPVGQFGTVHSYLHQVPSLIKVMVSAIDEEEEEEEEERLGTAA